MPVHDWTRVPTGIFHDFHLAWSTHLVERLNKERLPQTIYALTERQSNEHGERYDFSMQSLYDCPIPPSTDTHSNESYQQLRRTIAIRHVSGHEIVALIEIVSPANKDRQSSVDQFLEKVRQAVKSGVHVLLIDLLPPTKFDPLGLHAAF